MVLVAPPADPWLPEVINEYENSDKIVVAEIREVKPHPNADRLTLLDLYDGSLRARDADGAILVDRGDCSRYWELIFEEVKPWSSMKFPFLRSLGPEAGWYKVGPLARVQNCDRIDTPLADAARREFLPSPSRPAWTLGEPRSGAT